LSVVDPKKMQFTIDATAEAFNLPTKPDAATVYTEKFLPPIADRMLPKS
jgi:NitT/TauT family transport system substrate-binding protein